MDLLALVAMAQARTDLHARVAGACLKASWAIYYEDPATANHAARLAWAKTIMGNRDGMMDAATSMFLFFLSNATIQSVGAAATDNDIEFVVNSCVDIVAVN